MLKTTTWHDVKLRIICRIFWIIEISFSLRRTLNVHCAILFYFRVGWGNISVHFCQRKSRKTWKNKFFNDKLCFSTNNSTLLQNRTKKVKKNTSSLISLNWVTILESTFFMAFQSTMRQIDIGTLWTHTSTFWNWA